MGLVAPRLVGSSQIRDRTHVSCIGRSILYHLATREARRPRFLISVTDVGFIYVNVRDYSGKLLELSRIALHDFPTSLSICLFLVKE